MLCNLGFIVGSDMIMLLVHLNTAKESKEQFMKSHSSTDISPRAIIIAGPNGAGKTTFAGEFLQSEGSCPTFINADLIAAGLSPFLPQEHTVRAMRLMAETMHSCVKALKDFAIESTLSGRTYARQIRTWRNRGYRVKIIFFKLTSVDLAIARVRVRVRQGGHDVPEDVIRRRFAQGWANFQHLYMPLVDTWQIYDSSGETPVLVEEGGPAR
jgi:predicted ABC-type ATPase